MRAILSLISLLAVLLSTPALAAPVAVTVSIPPQKYFVEQIGGDAVAVTVMAAKGQDPHSYEPTASQMEGIAKAELYFAIGVPFETQWVPKFQSLNPAMRVVDLLDAIPRIEAKPDLALRGTLPGKGQSRHGHGHEHGHEGLRHGLDTDDPHAWLSPSDMVLTLPLIVAALGEKRPDRAGDFTRRGQELQKKLTELSTHIQTVLAARQSRTFLTLHQSWTHYARAFGLHDVSVELDGREPGPKSMAMLTDFAKKNNVRVIVTDAMSSKAIVAAIAKGINAEVVIADPLAEDWPTALREFSEKLAAALGAQQ